MGGDTSIERGAAADLPHLRHTARRSVRGLADWIDSGPPPRRARRLALRVAEAVAHLHAQGDVHGALSPSVISVGARDEIAFAPPDEPMSTLGRLRYASPEVARGEVPTSASDVFSLALIVRELIEGEPARRGIGDAIAIEAIDGRVSIPRGLDGELRELALLAAGQHADQRPSAADWAKALAQDGRAELWRDGKRALVGIIAVSVIVLALLLRTSFTAQGRTELRYEEARDSIHAFLAGTYEELARVEAIEPLAAAGARALAAVVKIDEADRGQEDHELLAHMLLWNGQAQRVRGQTDEARDLLTRAAASAVDVSDDRLAATIELRAVTALGEMAREARDPDSARDHFQRALEVGETRFALGDADRDLCIAYAYTLIRFGDLSMTTGKQSARRARQIYRKARGILDDPGAGIGTRDRDALELRAELDRLEANMAWQAGERERAIELLHSYVDRAERLIEMDPGLPRRRKTLASGARVLALVQSEAGELQFAVESLRTSVEAWRLLREMEPDKLEWRREWARSTRFLADVLARVGQWQESAALHEDSVSLLEGMLATGSLPKSSRLEIGTQLLDAAQVQLATGNLQRARDRWQRSADRLGTKAPSKRVKQKWFAAHARSRVVGAEILLAEGRWIAAEKRALKFVAELQERSTKGEDEQLRRERARSLLVVATVRAMDGDEEIARDARERALALAEELLGETPTDPELMALKTRVLFALGRDEETAVMLEQLDEIDYRDLNLSAVRAAISALRR